ELEPGKNRVVPDPYYNNGFETVYQLLNQACNEIIQKYYDKK
ncbi:protein-tyrosine-phosphatase, partial [Sphingobacteriales bacterium UPWRP_1]